MSLLRSLLVLYLAAVGLAFNIAVVVLWLERPDLIWAARAQAQTWLVSRFPALAPADTTRAELSDARIFAGIGRWMPHAHRPGDPAPGTARVRGRVYESVAAAVAALQPGDVLEIGPGTYREAMVIRTPRVEIVGRGHVVFEKAAAGGKANMVVAANDVAIRNIECREITVRDGNGACIRHEGQNLLVDHVYYHDAQQGILTGGNPGLVDITDSRFERLGHRGRAHGIYIGGGRLSISDSAFLASRSQGHEIKSRAQENTILRTVVASLNGVDSRLIDISNGGALTIASSVLQEGPNSVNGDMIGFALEGAKQPANNRVTIRGNLVIVDRDRLVRFLHLKDPNTPTSVVGNVFVSSQDLGYRDGNLVYKNRNQAGLAPYPALPMTPADR
jgi:hypothetical protein